MINDGAGVTMDMEENEAVENIDVVDVETGATTGKRKDAPTGCQGPKWKSLEGECLIDVWKSVSLDPITGANQTSGKYYKRIMDKFSERRHFGEYAKIHMIWNKGAISHRWAFIKATCNKFYGCLEMIRNKKQSGASMTEYMS
jgi:hypothetical protein